MGPLRVRIAAVRGRAAGCVSADCGVAPQRPSRRQRAFRPESRNRRARRTRGRNCAHSPQHLL